ncbi:ribonuclease HIII [Clostridium sp. CAG:609]|nr:ribonuclease HIII [Clostridium sp. CAG:609]
MTIVFKVSDNIKPKIIKYYENLKRDKTPPYAIFQAEEAGTIVTMYESGKIMFQGISADIDARIWIEMEKKYNDRDIDIKTGKEKSKKKSDTSKKNYNKYNTIGSDEVGTGDYFGPIVVCATYVSTDKQALLQDLKVMDSKKITDDKIKKIAPIIMKEIPYQAYILTNKEYNTLNHDEVNMNKIKAILHNKVLTSLKNKNYPYDLIVVDQFTTPKSYYNYLINVPNKVTDITFTPKAEDQCLSVACASIISRYIFLQEMYKMSKELNQEVPKGAGPSVIEFTQKLVKEQGIDILNNYVKLNFQTTNKIKE